MIVGNLVSADGGFRRKNLRKSHLLSEEDRFIVLNYLNELVKNEVDDNVWFGINTLFPNIPESLENTPMMKIYDACMANSEISERQRHIEVKKHMGLFVRECISLSDDRFFERFEGSVKTYKRTRIAPSLVACYKQI